LEYETLIKGSDHRKMDLSKKWDECPLEEKIERLRYEQMNSRSMMNAAYQLASRCWRLLHGHRHDAVTGELLQKVQEHGSGAEAGEVRRQDTLA
jgi:hypothetical protein